MVSVLNLFLVNGSYSHDAVCFNIQVQCFQGEDLESKFSGNDTEILPIRTLRVVPTNVN